MKTDKPEFLVFLLALGALVAIVVLLLLGKDVPVELWAIASALFAAGFGITVPTGTAPPTSTAELAPEVTAFLSDMHGLISPLLADVEETFGLGNQAPTPATPPVASPVGVSLVPPVPGAPQ